MSGVTSDTVTPVQPATVVAYNFRKIPASLWFKVKLAALRQNVSVRVWLLRVITEALR